MASPQQLQEAWQVFADGLASTMRQWTVIGLAVEYEWGGAESTRKRQILQDELLNMFRTKKELYRDQVEDFLIEFLEEEFNTFADDGSPAEVATLLVDMFRQCGRLDFTISRSIMERESTAVANHKKSASQQGMRGSDTDGDSSSDEEMDVATGLAPEAAAVGPPAPRVPDPDGWETVPAKGKGRRRP